MDFNDSPTEAAFRAEARTWLAANAPAFEKPKDGKLSDADLVAAGKAWQKRLFEGGYAGITLPRERGGRGATSIEDVIFGEEESKYRLPKGPFLSVGTGQSLYALFKHGTPEQIERLAAATLKGEITWCQLFSEPGAGSDLANLRTRAVRDGDSWIVNGQKVWSSWAHHSDWGILMARTDPSVPKHKGLTFFVVDMKLPGIEIRPIRQISGESDFNETFMTDVRIPDDCRIGGVGEGWAVAMTVLMAERLKQGGSNDLVGVPALLRYAASTPTGEGTALDSPALRLALARAYAEEKAETHFQSRLRTMVSRGENPGALASITKLASASRMQKTSGIAMEMREMAGIAHDPSDTETARIWHDYIWATAMRIAGGADEVLRNQLSERVLSMPGELRADKNVPFDKL